jgi:hypothetical protein
MKNFKIIYIAFFSLLVFNACKKEEAIDKEKPSINLSLEDAFPLNCDTLYFGEVFSLNFLFSDNIELGSFSIDIHNNFDQHSHSTEVSECSSEPIKSPINPFLFIQDYNIPSGLKQYETSLEISIPSSDENGIFDEGDYHFFISLTDKEGWSAQKGISIKMRHL